MSEFWADLTGGLPFLRNALFIALLSSIALGTAGTFVVINRITYLAGALSHCVLGGIGFAYYAQGVWGWAWMEPWLGALGSACLAAVLLSWIVRRGGDRADTAISALWCAGMASGLLFIAATPGYIDPMGYLFGNILLVSHTHLWIALVLDVVLVGALVLFWRPLYALSLDETFARLRGVPTGLYHCLLLIMIALTIVMLVQIVGIVLVIAMLSLPAALAGRFTRRLFPMMSLTVLLCALMQTVGLSVSYALDMPSGACIVLVTSLAYALGLMRKHS